MRRTAGSAKSVFSFYLFFALWEHLRTLQPARRFAVVFHTARDLIVLRPSLELERFGPDAAPVELKLASTVYLFDCSKNFNCDLKRCGYPCWQLVTASPNKEHFHEFVKELHVVLYLSLWEIDELLLARAAVYPMRSLPELHFLFSLWGGVARRIFNTLGAQGGQRQQEMARAIEGGAAAAAAAPADPAAGLSVPFRSPACAR